MYIADFESQIEEKILLRGMKYFEKGYVVDMWSETSNHYHAVVEGSIPYDVEIHLGHDGEILSHFCDCPYDWGEYCKHEVAVLLAVRVRLEQGTSIKRNGKQRGMRALLKDQKKDVLVNILCELAAEHDLREDIFYHLENSNDDR